MEWNMKWNIKWNMDGMLHIMSWNNFCVYFRVFKMAANGVEALLLSFGWAAKLSFSSMSQTQKFL